MVSGRWITPLDEMSELPDMKTRAAEPASPGRRRRGLWGGQEVPQSGRPWVPYCVAIISIATHAHFSWAAGPIDVQNGQKAASASAASCKPVYLTIDTGHMEVAPLIADVLKALPT